MGPEGRSIHIFLKKRWRSKKDMFLDIITYLMVISLLIASFCTLLDWFVKTITGSFLLSKIEYNTFSIYFIIMFIICDIVFVFLFDDNTSLDTLSPKASQSSTSNNNTTSTPQRYSVDIRSKVSSIQSMKYSISHPIQTMREMTKEELILIILIFISYIMRCTQYNSITEAYTVIHDIGYGVVRFLTFLHINDYYGIRPYLLSLSFLMFLLRDIVGFLYVITIDSDLDPVNDASLLVIFVNFTTDFYLFHKLLARLIYPNVNVYHNNILKFDENLEVYSNGFGGIKDKPLSSCCFKDGLEKYMDKLNLFISAINCLISLSLIYFTFDRRYRKSILYFSLLNYFCVTFILQSFMVKYIKTGENKTFSAFKICNILFYLSVFRFFSLSEEFWFIWVNILNTLLFIDLVFFIGELNHYKNDWCSKLRIFSWFIMCLRYYYEGLSGLQDTLYGSQANGYSVLLWNFGLFFEQNTYFTVMKLVIFKYIWWDKDQFRFQNIIEFQKAKRDKTNNYGVDINVAWKKSIDNGSSAPTSTSVSQSDAAGDLPNDGDKANNE